MELMHTHPAFDGERIELVELTCDCEENARDLVEVVDESEPKALPLPIGDSGGQAKTRDVMTWTNSNR